MLSKNHPIILFIDRNGFSIYQDILTDIPKFNFTPDLVSNLDVVNKEQFASLIATFIQINKIIPSSLAVILSENVVYEKNLIDPLQSSKEEIQNFLGNIPFEEVLAKVIKTDKTSRIVAVNKDLVTAIIDAFVGKGSIVEAITPSFIYGQSANFTAGLTSDNIRVILENAEILRSGNLLTDQEKMILSQNLESELKNPPAGAKLDLTNEAKKPQNLRQYILVGVFVTLLVILAVVYLNLGASQTPPTRVKTRNTSVNTVSVPTQALITTAPVDLKSIKIKIVQRSQADEKAINLKSELLSIGLADIVSEVSEATVAEKSSIVFSQNIPADLRNNIIIGIKKILPEISVLENPDLDFTINIIIGKS
jgi:hypothetical protein